LLIHINLFLTVHRLIASPGGLSTFLSTVNYTLYLLTYLEAKSGPFKARLDALLQRNAATAGKTVAIPTGPSNIAALGSSISQTRTLLRCLGLFPMYAWARSLSGGAKGSDAVLHQIAVVQCAFYTIYQFLESAAFLTDVKVVPATWSSRWTASSGGTTAVIYKWSYRMWMFGIACDFVRMAREAQLTREKRARYTYKEKDDRSVAVADQAADEKFYTDLVVPLAWFPMAFHYSEWNGAGVPGWNLGWMGFSGLVASYTKAKNQWAATA
jgi:hypothetical protein